MSDAVPGVYGPGQSQPLEHSDRLLARVDALGTVLVIIAAELALVLLLLLVIAGWHL